MIPRSCIITITGPLCAGKSTVAGYVSEFFDEHKIPCTIVSLDKIGHDVLDDSQVRDALLKEFGSQILDELGLVDRSMVAVRAFENHNSVRRLNEITHPRIIEQSVAFIEEALTDGDVVIVEAPFPIQNLGPLLDLTTCNISVMSPSSDRQRRARDRGMHAEDVMKRMALQPSSEDYGGMADVVIANQSDTLGLREQVFDVLTRLTFEERS